MTKGHSATTATWPLCHHPCVCPPPPPPVSHEDLGEGVGAGAGAEGAAGVEGDGVDGFLVFFAVRRQLLHAGFVGQVPQAQRAVVTWDTVGDTMTHTPPCVTWVGTREVEGGGGAAQLVVGREFGEPQGGSWGWRTQKAGGGKNLGSTRRGSGPLGDPGVVTAGRGRDGTGRGDGD